MPEYFIPILTEKGDFVLDPFAGSCVTGAVAEKLARRWICVELVEDYLRGAMARFREPEEQTLRSSRTPPTVYKLPSAAALWSDPVNGALPDDSGQHYHERRAGLHKNTISEG